MLFRLIIILPVLLCASSTYSQVPAHAQKLYNKAMEYHNEHKNEKSFTEMQLAIKAYPRYEQAYGILGAWYFQSHRYKLAAELYQQASYNCGQKNYARLLATSYLYNGQTTDALYVMRSFGTHTEEWKKLERQSEFIRLAKVNAWPDTVFNMGIRLNTMASEMYPCISADGKTIFYTRSTNFIDEDFYRSDADSCGGWLSGKTLGYPLNTSSQEAAQMISADQHYLFFMRCDNKSENGWEGGGCDLYMAYTADSIWSAPQSFGATINTPAYEGMPCLSPDNRELYFVSDRPGGYGGLDIWKSRFEHGLWQEPINLGANINTSGNETAPFLFADNETLYFASDGQPGMGGSDLFMSKKNRDTTWSKAKNLGYPINTTYDEASITLSSDGQHAYLSSNRDSIEANFDLYEMKMPISLQPKPVAYIKCMVYDSLTKAPLNYAGVFLTDIHGKDLYHYTSNRGDGSLMITMPIGVKYPIQIDRIGYQEFFDTLYYNEESLGKFCEHSLAMLPFDYVKPTTDTTILKIFFKKNSVELTDSSKIKLHEVMQYWLPRKDFSIFISGYTDNTGTPIINEQLSYKRAGIVTKEITAMGFNDAVMTSQGWGEANPLADNDTEEHRDMNRRVEIVIRQ